MAYFQHNAGLTSIEHPKLGKLISWAPLGQRPYFLILSLSSLGDLWDRVKYGVNCMGKKWDIGCLPYLIFLCVCAFFSKIFVPEFFFSKSRLCTQPLFSHFVSNLDWLAGQPIQIFFRVQDFFVLVRIFYVFPHGVNPVGDNCMMTKASLRRSHLHNSSILGMTKSPIAIVSAGLTMPIVLRCLCCRHHCLVFLLSLLWLAASLLFGVIVAIVAIDTVVAIIAIIAIIAVALFAPVIVALATIVVILAVVATWFLLLLLLFGIIVAVVAIVTIVAIVAAVAVVAVALFAPVAVALAAIVIALVVVATTVLAIAAALVPGWLLCPSSPSSLGEVSVITLVALTLVALDPLTFFVALVAIVFTALTVAIRQCLLSAAKACNSAACLSSADAGAAAASCPPAEPLLPLVAFYFIMDDCYFVALAPAPSSHCCSCHHHCNRFVIVTARPHLRGNPYRRRKRWKKSIFNLRHNELKKANLDQVFSKSRSGTIAHKNKKELWQSPISSPNLEV
jgi:hypothetical protein